MNQEGGGKCDQPREEMMSEKVTPVYTETKPTTRGGQKWAIQILSESSVLVVAGNFGRPQGGKNKFS